MPMKRALRRPDRREASVSLKAVIEKTRAFYCLECGVEINERQIQVEFRKPRAGAVTRRNG